jgi:hypothetical protein
LAIKACEFYMKYKYRTLLLKLSVKLNIEMLVGFPVIQNNSTVGVIDLLVGGGGGRGRGRLYPANVVRSLPHSKLT